ncbi:hypothetical protein JCM19296_1436 [Nonlabens ulvanivorans]|uniref:Uncharacterized protein n=1 Tax=Nonlabens ulvanivorans TaxID=906888 RepID=A0A081DA98_NONUL|nr:hypothetical protein JCM19296_1436 [Nonlabens ulvanivorans]
MRNFYNLLSSKNRDAYMIGNVLNCSVLRLFRFRESVI